MIDDTISYWRRPVVLAVLALVVTCAVVAKVTYEALRWTTAPVEATQGVIESTRTTITNATITNAENGLATSAPADLVIASPQPRHASAADRTTTSDQIVADLQPDAVLRDTAPSQQKAYQRGEKHKHSQDLAAIRLLLDQAGEVDSRNDLAAYQLIIEQIIGQLELSPYLIDEVIRVYESAPTDESERFLKYALVSAADRLPDLTIEHHAIDRLSLANDSVNVEAASDWLSVLGEIGANSTETRSKLLETMPTLTAPADLTAAISSLRPTNTSATEQQRMETELTPYLVHPNDAVRGAAITSLAMWADSNTASIIEQGLADSSAHVRHAASLAALDSNIQSDGIKFSLLNIVNNTQEPMENRLQAANSLTEYQLVGSELGDLHKFQSMRSTIRANDRRGAIEAPHKEN